MDNEYGLDYNPNYTYTVTNELMRKPVPQSYFDQFDQDAYFSANRKKFCFARGINGTSSEVQVFSKNNIFLDAGFAFLHPNDEFNPTIGAKLALTDVLPELNLTRGERFEIWHRFFETVGKNIMSKNI